MKLARGAVDLLFGKDQLAEFGGLETVERAVVHDSDRLAAAQQVRAFDQRRRPDALRGHRAAAGLVKRRVAQNGEGVEGGWHLKSLCRNDD